ncbi:MAG TPA: tetratricopeptide repeat protein [Luteimonas sp.]|nr:tetratricopeptide repeat protein [Luteimonas sp.]
MKPVYAAIGLIAWWASACASPIGATAPIDESGFFQRYSAPDPSALEKDIEQARDALAAARERGDEPAELEAAADLGGMLTTARQEAEARAILVPAVERARLSGDDETLGWLLLNLATANQYLHRSTEAAEQFPEALQIARASGDTELEHYTLHHWGRFLAETGQSAQARERFSQALALRVRLNEPRQESTRRALRALDALESTDRPPEP